MVRNRTYCRTGRLLLLLLIGAGCKTSQHVRDPEYAQLAQSSQRAAQSVDAVAESINPVFPHLEGPHSVDEYIQVALDQNPDVQAARKRVEAMAYQVPVAASLPDPMVNMTAQPAPVQTASGAQQFTFSANQKFYLFGKLDARAGVAETKTNVARAQLAAAELETITKVKKAYYELYYIQQAIQVTREEQQLLREIRDIANVRYKTGRVSQQDVLRADLEISNVETELIQLHQQLISGQARLARILHIAPQTEVRALASLTPEEAPRDLQFLQNQAIEARPELHAALAAVMRDRQSAELARLEYKPDVTLGFSYVSVGNYGVSRMANGQDILLLTAGLNLPVYRKRIDSSVKSAEANAVASARTYDSLHDGTLEEVTDLFARAQSHQNTLVLFREDILPKSRQTLEVSSRAYNVGEVDFLQLIDNWRLLLRYELTARRLEANLRQTLAELEQIVGGLEHMPSQTPEDHPALMPVPDSDLPLF